MIKLLTSPVEIINSNIEYTEVSVFLHIVFLSFFKLFILY